MGLHIKTRLSALKRQRELGYRSRPNTDMQSESYSGSPKTAVPHLFRDMKPAVSNSNELNQIQKACDRLRELAMKNPITYQIPTKSETDGFDIVYDKLIEEINEAVFIQKDSKSNLTSDRCNDKNNLNNFRIEIDSNANKTSDPEQIRINTISISELIAQRKNSHIHTNSSPKIASICNRDNSQDTLLNINRSQKTGSGNHLVCLMDKINLDTPKKSGEVSIDYTQEIVNLTQKALNPLLKSIPNGDDKDQSTQIAMKISII